MERRSDGTTERWSESVAADVRSWEATERECCRRRSDGAIKERRSVRSWKAGRVCSVSLVLVGVRRWC